MSVLGALELFEWGIIAAAVVVLSACLAKMVFTDIDVVCEDDAATRSFDRVWCGEIRAGLEWWASALGVGLMALAVGLSATTLWGLSWGLKWAFGAWPLSFSTVVVGVVAAVGLVVMPVVVVAGYATYQCTQ